MTKILRGGAAALVLFLTAGQLRATETVPCAADPATRDAMRASITLWERTAASALQLKKTRLPWIVFFDARCAWHVEAAPGAKLTATLTEEPKLALGDRSVSLHSTEHSGAVALPGGEVVPPGMVMFASTYGDDNPFMVMPLTSIWRANGHQNNSNVETVARAVFVHEMTHTAQTRLFAKAIGDVITREKLDDDSINDDVVQDRFGKDPEMREAYTRERDLLFEAASEKDLARRRSLVRRAVTEKNERHRTFFSGENTWYGELEDVFINMEGAAQWAGYRAAMLDGATHDEALNLIRGKAKRWTQDEGLALYLALDSLVAGWQQKMFSATPPSAWDLLATAVR